MCKSFKIILTLFILAGSSQCLSQDKLNPVHFIELQKRTNDKIDPLKTGPLLTYIKPGTNIRINFLKDKMRKAIGIDSEDELGNILIKLDSLTALGESLEKEKATAIAADSSKEEEIWKKYNEQIKKQVTQPQLKLTKAKKQIKLTVKATVTLKNGKTYNVTVPNYYNVVPQNDTTIVTSITQRVFQISTKGFRDRIVDTEIDLVEENLRENDVVKLEIETDDDGVRRKYIKRFVISEHGWKLEFPPSVLFVKRRHEPKDSTGKEINPSNFKPAPGGSMLLSYKPKGGLLNQLLTGWSFGVNVSLLDFEIDNNLELGVGFIAYGFNRLLGGGYGWNLHASEKESYFFISLDFLRTFETFKVIFAPGEE